MSLIRSTPALDCYAKPPAEACKVWSISDACKVWRIPIFFLGHPQLLLGDLQLLSTISMGKKGKTEVGDEDGEAVK